MTTEYNPLVSHETHDKLKQYQQLLLKWSSKLNLIQEKSLDHFWNRHVLDAWQLMDQFESKNHYRILDIGSGAGLPGIVLGILGCHDVYLCEINTKRATFLNEVIRQLQLDRCFVIDQDVKKLDQKFNIITARAFSSFEKLLPIAKNVSCETGALWLFFKGKNYKEELSHLQKSRITDYEIVPSKTSSESVIFKIQTG